MRASGLHPRQEVIEAGLETRVAKTEVGLDRLTDDVRDLASVVRSQGAAMEAEIQKLVVAVTQAAGPRKTDWSTIISAVFLILAIGSAVFWPLNQTAQNNKTDTSALAQEFKEHNQLELHPVGQALVKRLEDQLKIHIENNNRENDLMRESIRSEIDHSADKVMVYVNKIDAHQAIVEQQDHDELQMWRNKAFGLSSPSSPK